MSKKLLAFLLSELATVRVKCVKPECGVVTELTVETMDRLSGGECKFCGASFGFPNFQTQSANISSFMLVANGLKQLQNAAKDKTRTVAEIEFIIPDPDAM